MHNFNSARRSYIKFSLLLALIPISTSCQRKTEETSKISISLPGIAANQKSISQSVSASGSVQTQSAGWNSSLAPTLLSQISCYGVIVGGPEDSMRQNKCSKESGANAINFGVMGGFFAAGSTIELDVPSGSSRYIKVFGMQSDGTACVPFKEANDSYFAHMSHPFFLGEVGNINMAPGENVRVTVPVASTLDTANYFEDCQGPIFNSGGGGGGTPAKYQVITQDNLTNFYPYSCVPMQLRIVDANGGGANVSGSYSTTIAEVSGQVLFSASSDCSSATSTLSISYSSYNTQQFFARMPASNGTIQFKTQSPSSGATSIADITIPGTYSVITDPGANYSLVLVDADNLKSIRGVLPQGNNNACRRYFVQVQNSSTYIPFGQSGIKPGGQNGTGSPNQFTFTPTVFSAFGASDCSGAALTFGSGIDFTNVTIYGNFQSTAANEAISYVLSSGVSAGVPSSSILQVNPVSVSGPAQVPGAITKLGFQKGNSSQFVTDGVSANVKIPAACEHVGDIVFLDAANIRNTKVGTYTFNSFPAEFYKDSGCTASMNASFSGTFPSVRVYASSSVLAGTFPVNISGLSPALNFTVAP